MAHLVEMTIDDLKAWLPSTLDNIGIMENEMETTILYWGYIGIMENKMVFPAYLAWIVVPCGEGLRNKIPVGAAP